MARLLGLLTAVVGLVLVAASPSYAQKVNTAGYKAASLPCASGVLLPVIPAGTPYISAYVACNQFVTTSSLPGLLSTPGDPITFVGFDASGHIRTSPALGGGSVTSVGLSVPSWLQVTGTNPITVSGTFSITAASQSANLFLASPSGSSGVLAPRAITAADINGLSPTFGALTVSSCSGCGGGSTVSITAGNAGVVVSPSPLTGTGSVALNIVAAPVTHQWVSSITAAGVATMAQPGFADISGSASAAQMATNLSTAISTVCGGSTVNFVRGDGTCTTPAGGGNVNTSGSISVGALGVWASGTGLAGTVVPGTGVLTALANATNATGGFVTFGSGTNPTFGTLTVSSCTGCGGGGSGTVGSGIANQVAGYTVSGATVNGYTIAGDLTGAISGSNFNFTIANNAVTTAKVNASAITYAKMQSGASTGLLGINNGSAPTEVGVGSGLSLSGGTLTATGGGGGSPPSGATNSLQYNAGGSAFGGLGSLGTTTTVLHGNASGLPSFGAVGLTTDVTGILPAGNGGSGAATFTANAILKGAGASPFAVSSILDAGSGVTIGSPTGGAQGVGTINVTGCFINGVACATSSGGGVTWPASGDIVVSNSTSAPTGIVPGTGVASALAINVSSAGSFLVNGGVLGTPSSGTATHLTGLPISTGVSGLGSGVATALAIAPNSTGGFALDGSSSNPTFGTLTVTSCTGCGGGGSTTITAGPGLGSSPTTLNGLNGGSIQTVTNASTLSKQLGSVTKSANYTMNTVGAGDCFAGFKCDEARTIILGGTGEVITAPTPSGDLNGNYVVLNPTADTTATIVATGGSNFQYCLASPASTLPIPAKTAVQITDNGSGYNCFAVPLAASSGGGTPANPTATITTSIQNGSASTYMRSDAAPAAAVGSNSAKGYVQGDGVTIDCATTPGTCVSATGTTDATTSTSGSGASPTAAQFNAGWVKVLHAASLTATFPAVSTLGANGVVTVNGLDNAGTIAATAPDTITSGAGVTGAGGSVSVGAGCFAVVSKISTGLSVSGNLCAATGAGTGTANTFTAQNIFSGNVIPAHPAALTTTGNLDPTSTNMCGGTVEYNSGSAGTLSVLSSWPVGCNVSVTAIGTGLATVAAGTGTVHSACTTVRTRAQYSTIWIRSSNTGGVGVVDVSGDCG